MKTLTIKTTLTGIGLSMALVSFSGDTHARNSIGVSGDWVYVQGSPLRARRAALSYHGLSRATGNSVNETLYRAEDKCQAAVDKELNRGSHVAAYRARITNQVGTYHYTADCDIYLIPRGRR